MIYVASPEAPVLSLPTVLLDGNRFVVDHYAMEHRDIVAAKQRRDCPGARNYDPAPKQVGIVMMIVPAQDEFGTAPRQHPLRALPMGKSHAVGEHPSQDIVMKHEYPGLSRLCFGERLTDAGAFPNPKMALHRKIPGLQCQRTPGKTVGRQRAHDQRFRKLGRRREDGSKVLSESLVFGVGTERDQRPLPPLDVVVARNHVYRCGALEFTNEPARRLELAVAGPVGEIARENDQARIQVGNEVFHRTDLAEIGVEAKMWIGQVDDAETHGRPAIAGVG